MYSGRRTCVQRHIDNINIHNGKASAIPFIEYLVGRREGLYPPGERPTFSSEKHRTLADKMQDELENTFARRVVETSLPPVGDCAYHSGVVDLTDSMNNQRNRSHRNELIAMFQALQVTGKQNTDTKANTTDITRKHEVTQDLREDNKKLQLVLATRKQNRDAKANITDITRKHEVTQDYDP
jgi:hypothetical protein